MNESSDSELDRLFSDAVDGLLSEEGEARLTQRLRDEPEARRHYLRYMGTDAALQWEYADAAAEPVVSEFSRPRGGRPILWAAAAAVLFFAVGFWMIPERSESIGTILFTDGAEFRPTSGGERVVLEDNTEIPGGRLSVSSGSGMATARFTDGSEITLSGGSVVQIDDFESGLSFELEKGQLSSTVAPQTDGRAFRVRTETSEAVVLGTVFSLSTSEHSSTVSVDEGAVLFRRLADGAEIQVESGETAEAGLLSSEPLRALPSGPVPDEWSLDLSPSNQEVTNGGSASVGGRPCLVAQPYVAGRDDDGSKAVRTGIAINGRFVRVEKETVLRMRYRSDWGPIVFLGTAKESGRFGGNFEVRLTSSKFPPGPDGWREVEVPLSDFTPVAALSDRGFRIEDNVIKKIIVSVHDEHRLQVSDLSVSAK